MWDCQKRPGYLERTSFGKIWHMHAHTHMSTYMSYLKKDMKMGHLITA